MLSEVGTCTYLVFAGSAAKVLMASLHASEPSHQSFRASLCLLFGAHTVVRLTEARTGCDVRLLV